MTRVLFIGMALLSVGFYYSYVSYKNSGSKLYLALMGISLAIFWLIMAVLLDVITL